MSIATTWDNIEAALKAKGFQLAGPGDVVQGNRCQVRISRIDDNNSTRGAIQSGVIRLSWELEIVLTYEIKNDMRQEREIGRDAELVIAGIYASGLTNHHFSGASIDRTSGVLKNTIRFEFQDEARL